MLNSYEYVVKTFQPPYWMDEHVKLAHAQTCLRMCHPTGSRYLHSSANSRRSRVGHFRRGCVCVFFFFFFLNYFQSGLEVKPGGLVSHRRRPRYRPSDWPCGISVKVLVLSFPQIVNQKSAPLLELQSLLGYILFDPIIYCAGESSIARVSRVFFRTTGYAGSWCTERFLQLALMAWFRFDEHHGDPMRMTLMALSSGSLKFFWIFTFFELYIEG